MFFKKNVGNPKNTDEFGRLYVLRFEMRDGTILHKIGMCNSDRSVSRMMEILQSFFQQYRYIPSVTMRKNKKFLVPLLVEQHIHEVLDEFNFRFDKKFDGSTEFFGGLNEQVVLSYIDNIDYNIFLDSDKIKDSELKQVKDYLDKQEEEDHLLF